MSEETLNRLFEEARNEAPETNLSDIQKWIGLGSLGILIAGLLTKMKLIVTLKPFIMISSVIVAVGVSTGAFLMMNASEPEVSKHHTATTVSTVPTQRKTIIPTEESKPTKKALTVKAEEPLSPISQVMKWDNAETPYPNLQYCRSLPMAAPMFPVRPVIINRGVIVDDNEENKDYGFFDALKLSGAIDVVVIQGEKCGVRVEGDEKGKESVVINNNNKTLEIYTDCKGDKWKNECDFDLTVYVTVADLKKVNCSGASTMKSKGGIKFSDLEMIISGASDIDLTMDVTDLKMITSGASDIKLCGNAEKMNLINSGATEFSAENLKVKNAVVICSGASETSIYVSEDLDIKVSGASDVEYSGSPTHVKKSVSGASKINEK